MLTACQSIKNEQQNNDQVEKSKEISVETVLANVKAVLENESPTDYTLIEHKPIYFTGQKFPEVYALYRPKTASEGNNTINIIRVYQYNTQNNQWKTIHNQSIENQMQVSASEPMKLTKDKREQMMISVQEGSGAYLSYMLLGSHDKETISAWLDSFNNMKDEAYYQGNFKLLEDKYLVFYESDRVAAVYKWASIKLEKVDPTTIPELSNTTIFSDEDAENNIILIKYNINANQDIEANVPNKETIFAKVGQKISLVRENSNTSDVNTRILYSAQNDPYSIDSSTGEILTADIITVTIIPNGYDWEKAFEVYINAMDDTVVTP